MTASKILALDPGDQHVGVAISDSLRFFANPYETVPAANLVSFLNKVLAAEAITIVVIGYPKTLKNTVSQQTTKVQLLHDQLVAQFPAVQFVLWDERLTSQAAAKYVNSRHKADRLRAHAIAAAIILDSYLAHLRFLSET